MTSWLIAFTILLSVTGIHSDSATSSKKIVCYLGSWAGYRNGNGKFEVEAIQPNLCTHLIYSFVGITSSGGVRILDEWNDLPSGKDGIGRFNRLRDQSPSTKTLVAIGGWNEGSVLYSQVVNNEALRAAFVKNIVSFVQQYEFDGFDLDWEYPAQRGGAASDLDAYVLLLKELRPEFDKHGLLLTAAVGVGQHLVGTSYDVPSISKYLDFVNMMAYDLHTAWDGVTGQNAPLYASSADVTAEARTLNVNSTIRYWIQNGASPDKLVLGMGTYGRTFTTSSSHQGPGAPCSGPGTQGPYTFEAGMIGYNELCESQKNGGWSVTWDDEQKVPYATKGNQWVGYDNVESIKIKSEFALDLGLGGGMIWSLETDDFLGLCHGTKFPLLRAINEVLNGGTSGNGGSENGNSGASSSSSTSTTTTTTTTKAPSGGNTGICAAEGYVRDPADCQMFYQCVLVNSKLISYAFKCYGDLVFDPSLNTCNYKSLVAC